MARWDEPGYWWRRFWERMAIAAFVMPFLALYDLMREEGTFTPGSVAVSFVVLWAIGLAILYKARLWPFHKR